MKRTTTTTIGMKHQKQRDEVIDIVKGIGILAVIVGHMTEFGRQFIFSFHMPLFFLIGGFLYKPRSLKKCCSEDFKRLIIPYIITAGFIAILMCILSLVKNMSPSYWIIAALYGSGSQSHTSQFFGDVPSIGAIWFLWAMFWCRLSFQILNVFINRVVTLGLACLVISILAVWIDEKIINLPFAILPGLAAIIFYFSGYAIKKLGGIKTLKPQYAILLISIWMLSTFIPDEPLGLVTCRYPIYPINVFGGICGTLSIYVILSIIYKYVNFRLIWAPLIWLGEVSLVILCFHIIDLDVPIRRFLGINSAIGAIVFDLTFCIFGTIFLSQFSLSRSLLKINKINIPLNTI